MSWPRKAYPLRSTLCRQGRCGSKACSCHRSASHRESGLRRPAGDGVARAAACRWPSRWQNPRRPPSNSLIGSQDRRTRSSRIRSPERWSTADEPQVVLNAEAMRIVSPSEKYVQARPSGKGSNSRAGRVLYLGDQTRISPSGRNVIIVDDGHCHGRNGQSCGESPAAGRRRGTDGSPFRSRRRARSSPCGTRWTGSSVSPPPPLSMRSASIRPISSRPRMPRWIALLRQARGG